jgi:hypothetical protein
MRRARFYCIISLALFCLVLTGCSGSKEAEQTKAVGKTAIEQTVEAIKDYGSKHIDKARATQQLGEDRTRTIDNVTGKQ